MVFPLISHFSVSKEQERHKRERDVPSRKNVVIFNARVLEPRQSVCDGEIWNFCYSLLWLELCPSKFHMPKSSQRLKGDLIWK
jgi:hypothetical protein